jgi:hypothetical protein
MLGNHTTDLQAAGIPGDIVHRLVDGGAIAGFGLTDGFDEAQRVAYVTAFSEPMSKTWILYTAPVGIGFAVSFGIRNKELMTSHEVTKTGLEAEAAKQQRYQKPKDGAGAVAVNG